MNPRWSLLVVGQDVTPEQAEQYERERLVAFNMIAPKTNWKLPIDAKIRVGDFEEANSAALWFTGGPLEIVKRDPGKNADYDVYHVRGDGYYNNVGA